MATPNIQYVATLNAQQVFNQLNIINQTIDKTTTEASKGFGETGTQIGLVSGVVSSLTTEFIRLGQQAVGALIDIGKESIGLASDLEVTEKIFTGIFQGNEEAAVGALQHIREQSRGLGIDVSDIAKSFLPFVGSLKQLDQVTRAAAALAISQPEQGEVGARIALQEALSGNMQSLVRRFEIPKNLGTELQKAFDKGGIDEFLVTFEGIMKRMGRDISQLTDTFEFSFSRAGISFKQLQEVFGTPVVDQLKEQFDTLNKTVEENFDDYVVIADTFGRIFANIADIIGTNINEFLAGLDTKQVTQIAEKLFDIVENARTLANVLLGTKVPFDLVDGIEQVANKLDEALTTAVQLSAMSAAGQAKAAAESKVWADEMERLHGKGTITTDVMKELVGIPGIPQLSNKLAELVGDTESQRVAALSAKAGEDAYNKSVMDSLKVMDESKKRKEENRNATEKLRESQEKGTEAGKKQANQFLDEAKKAEALADLKEKMAEAQAKVDKEMTEAEKDFTRKLEDIDTAFERKRMDIALEFAQKREDAAKKNLDKLSDLRKKNGQEVKDAEKDLNRKEQDIARKYSESRIDLERESRQKRVDIETDYRRKIQDIRTQFNLDADEAEQKRDAIAFLKALKDRDVKIQEAQTDRQRTIDDTRVTEEQKRQELALQRQRELEEAQIDNERKLEDLKISLERQIEEQNTAYARELDDLRVQETRKLEEAQTARERDIEDAKKAYDRKLEDLQTSLADELAILKEGNAKLEEEAQRHNQAMEESQRSIPTTSTTSRTMPDRVINDTVKKPITSRTMPDRVRQHGGPVTKGIPYVTHDKELFVPNENGMIMPKQRLMSILGSPSAVSNYSSSQNQQINIPMATAGQLLDPIFVAQLRNIIKTELGKVYG